MPMENLLERAIAPIALRGVACMSRSPWIWGLMILNKQNKLKAKTNNAMKVVLGVTSRGLRGEKDIVNETANENFGLGTYNEKEYKNGIMIIIIKKGLETQMHLKPL